VRLRITVLVLAMVGLGACAGSEPSGPPDVAGVFEAVVRSRAAAHLVVHRFRRVEPGLLDDTPYGADDPSFSWGMGRTPRETGAHMVRAELEGLRADTWQSFLAANGKESDVTAVLRLPEPVTVLSEEADREIFSKGVDAGWRTFFERFPRAEALCGLSLPGRSADGRQALLYEELLSGGECGHGTYFLLAWRDGGWHVVDTWQAWIA
jgi:hypothetical protein